MRAEIIPFEPDADHTDAGNKHNGRCTPLYRILLKLPFFVVDSPFNADNVLNYVHIEGATESGEVVLNEAFRKKTINASVNAWDQRRFPAILWDKVSDLTMKKIALFRKGPVYRFSEMVGSIKEMLDNLESYRQKINK